MKSLLINALKTVLKVLNIILNTIRYNGFFILLSIIAPIIIYKLGAGKDIIIFDLEKNDIYNPLIIVAGFIGISFAMYLVPVLSIDLHHFFIRSYTQEQKILTYESMYRRYVIDKCDEGKEIFHQIPSKYLAVLPWIIYIGAMVSQLIELINPKTLHDDPKEIITTIQIAIFIGVNYIILFSIRKTKLFSIKSETNEGNRKKYKRLKSIYFISLFIILIIFLFILRLNTLNLELPVKNNSPLIIKLSFIIFFNYLFMIIQFLYINTLNSLNTEIMNYNRTRKSHILLVVVCLSLYILFAIAYVRGCLISELSTIFVLMFISVFYITIFELLYFAPLLINNIVLYKFGRENSILVKRCQLYKNATHIVGIIFLLFIVLISIDNYEMNSLENSKISKLIKKTPRESITNYFDEWYKEKLNGDTCKEIDVVLLSSQGGGSRAAVMLLGTLLRIENLPNGFKDHLFSMSTVSGSSTGANMYLQSRLNKKLQKSNKKSSYVNANLEENQDVSQSISKIYNFNFLNSNLLGMSLLDGIVSPIYKLYTKQSFNRNTALIEEEKFVFEHFILGDSIRNEYKDISFTELYYGDSTKYKFPLLFLNTTIMSDGTKGVYYPVYIDKSYTRAIDLFSIDSNLKDGYYYPIINCVAASQSYPLLNIYSEIAPGTNLGDGGFYENTGTKTTLEIYQALKQHCIDKNYKVRFIILNIFNEYTSPDNKKSAIPYSTIGLTLNQVIKGPFSGQQKDAEFDLKKHITHYNILANKKDSTNFIRDTVIEIRNREDVAANRVLSQKSIRNLLDKMFLDTTDINYKSINFLTTNEYIREYKQCVTILTKNTVTQKLVEKPTIYIQYASKDLEKTVNDIVYSLNSLDFKVPPTELIKNKFENEIRYFHSDDKDIANNILELLKSISPINPYKARLIKGYEKMVKPKQIEIWIGKP